MFGMLKSNFSRIKSERIGSETFGAKTTELDRFKDVAEKANVIIPPHVSFPLEFFKSALIRNGFLTDAGVYTGKRYQRERDDGKLIEFTEQEKRIIIEAFSRFMDFIVAVRSDELTAKGVGVYSTNFLRVTKKALNDGTIFTMISDILANQFNPSANAFKRRAAMPHGIGIQIMPLVGDKHGIPLIGRRTVYPDLSLAGFTALEQNKLIVHMGLGIGGGVSNDATEDTWILDKRDEIATHASYFQNVFYHKTGEMISQAVKFSRFKLIRFREMMLLKMMSMAKTAGTDFYFECQTLYGISDLFLTQVSSHEWPKIEKPHGTEIPLIKNKHTHSDWVVGSTVVLCNDVFNFPTFRGDLSTTTPQTLKRLVVTISYRDTPRELKPSNFGTYEHAAAVLDECGHRSSRFSSHAGGLFRELGIPIINVESAPSGLKGKQFYVWADELNQKAGIVLP